MPRGWAREMRQQFRLRVRPMVPWPGDHAPTMRHITTSGALPAAPTDVWLILGKPVTPDRKWTCGTDVVWPVLEVENAPGFQMLDVAYVCRHQIIAGD